MELINRREKGLDAYCTVHCCTFSKAVSALQKCCYEHFWMLIFFKTWVTGFLSLLARLRAAEMWALKRGVILCGTECTMSSSVLMEKCILMLRCFWETNTSTVPGVNPLTYCYCVPQIQVLVTVILCFFLKFYFTYCYTYLTYVLKTRYFTFKSSSGFIPCVRYVCACFHWYLLAHIQVTASMMLEFWTVGSALTNLILYIWPL